MSHDGVPNRGNSRDDVTNLLEQPCEATGLLTVAHEVTAQGESDLAAFVRSVMGLSGAALDRQLAHFDSCDVVLLQSVQNQLAVTEPQEATTALRALLRSVLCASSLAAHMSDSQ